MSIATFSNRKRIKLTKLKQGDLIFVYNKVIFKHDLNFSESLVLECSKQKGPFKHTEIDVGNERRYFLKLYEFKTNKILNVCITPREVCAYEVCYVNNNK